MSSIINNLWKHFKLYNYDHGFFYYRATNHFNSVFSLFRGLSVFGYRILYELYILYIKNVERLDSVTSSKSIFFFGSTNQLAAFKYFIPGLCNSQFVFVSVNKFIKPSFNVEHYWKSSLPEYFYGFFKFIRYIPKIVFCVNRRHVKIMLWNLDKLIFTLGAIHLNKTTKKIIFKNCNVVLSNEYSCYFRSIFFNCLSECVVYCIPHAIIPKYHPVPLSNHIFATANNIDFIGKPLKNNFTKIYCLKSFNLDECDSVLLHSNLSDLPALCYDVLYLPPYPNEFSVFITHLKFFKKNKLRVLVRFHPAFRLSKVLSIILKLFRFSVSSHTTLLVDVLVSRNILAGLTNAVLLAANLDKKVFIFNLRAFDYFALAEAEIFTESTSFFVDISCIQPQIHHTIKAMAKNVSDNRSFFSDIYRNTSLKN